MRLLVISWLPLDPVDSRYKNRVVGLYTPLVDKCDLLILSPPPGPSRLPWEPLLSAQSPVQPGRGKVAWQSIRQTFSHEFRQSILQKAKEFEPDFILAEGLWSAGGAHQASHELKVPWGVSVDDSRPGFAGGILSLPFPSPLWFYAKHLYRHADRLFTTTVEEACRLQKALQPRPPRISVIPHGTHLARMVSEESIGQWKSNWHIYEGEKIGLFVGRMDYGPNRRGLEWFSKKVIPYIGELPFHIRWLAAGIPEPETPIPPFEFIGYVEDLDLVLAAADLCIAPKLSGGGTSIKVLDYLGAGCPVIATPKAALGLPVEPDKHLLVSDNPEEFSRYIRMVLFDQEVARKLGSEGRDLIAQDMIWEKIAERMLRECSRSLGLHGPVFDLDESSKSQGDEVGD